MIFLLTLTTQDHNTTLPINYAYPLSAAIYKIISRGDVGYADFLHEKGYGKGFKLFTFSQLKAPFRIEGDRMRLLTPEVQFSISFHLPQAMESFVRGLFQSESIEIADKKSKVRFNVTSIESLPNPLQTYRETELINIQLKPLSPVVIGLHNERGNYDFLSPDDDRFASSIVFNWRNKIAACYDEQTAHDALLMIEIVPMKNPPKSRLIWIKADTPEQTKIRGWMNFGLKVTGERRFVELLMNAGVGVYNGQGCGSVEVHI